MRSGATIAMLKDRGLREDVAWALGEIKDPRAVEPLMVIVLEHSNNSSDIYYRKVVGRALSKMKPNPLLALRKLEGKDATTFAKKFDTEWVCVCGALTRIGGKECKRCDRNRDFCLNYRSEAAIKSRLFGG